jgi:hypothetical protein
MNKLRPLIFALSVFGVSAAQAMPVVPLGPPQATLAIQIGYAYGCGLGVHRGPLGGCVPVYVYRGYDPYYRGYVRGYYRGYRRGYYAGRHDAYYPYVRHFPGDVVYVDRGVCGFGSYLSCSYGTCWRVCQ